jgi:hypothetical protein
MPHVSKIANSVSSCPTRTSVAHFSQGPYADPLLTSPSLRRSVAHISFPTPIRSSHPLPYADPPISGKSRPVSVASGQASWQTPLPGRSDQYMAISIWRSVSKTMWGYQISGSGVGWETWRLGGDMLGGEWIVGN